MCRAAHIRHLIPRIPRSLELRLTIFSVKTMQMRDVIIVPSTGWGGDGLLGLTIVFCKIEDVSEQAFRVLAVAENSPAATAGLRPDADFLLGTIHGRFESLEDVRDKAIAQLGNEWPLLVYDAELDTVREVTLLPSTTWWPGHEGGCGVLGCEFACDARIARIESRRAGRIRPGDTDPDFSCS